MPLERRDWITKEMMRAEPRTLFVFGDNLARWGKGGQAAVMRHEPNAVGLPTKRTPYEFLTDDDLRAVADASRSAVALLHKHVRAGGLVVWPSAGIGTGLAQLRQRAPLIAALYDNVLGLLEDTAAGRTR